MIYKLTRYRRYFAVLLLILTVLLGVNSALNRHIHLYHGHVVSHAHPYHKGNTEQLPVQSHHHSDFEFLIIEQITNLLIIAGVIFYLTTVLVLIRVVGVLPHRVFLELPRYSFQKNRAPPFNI